MPRRLKDDVTKRKEENVMKTNHSIDKDYN